MKRILLILSFFIVLPLVTDARQTDSDDPFTRDPIFTKPIDELIGISQSDEEDGARQESDDFDRVVRHLSTTGLDLGGGFEAGPYYSNALYSQYPNLPMFHFNRVNGLFIGLRKERMQWYRHSSFLDIPQIQPHGFIGWGTASKNWEYGIGLEKKIGERERLMVGAEYHKASSTEDFNRERGWLSHLSLRFWPATITWITIKRKVLVYTRFTEPADGSKRLFPLTERHFHHLSKKRGTPCSGILLPTGPIRRLTHSLMR
jgi:hypothetical protein